MELNLGYAETKFQGSRFRSIRHGQIHSATYNLRIKRGLFRATLDGWKKYPRTLLRRMGKPERNNPSLSFRIFAFSPHLSARQNLQLVPEVNASTPSIEEMTAQLGVDNCLDQSVYTPLMDNANGYRHHSGPSQTLSPPVARRTFQPSGRKSNTCLD